MRVIVQNGHEEMKRPPRTPRKIRQVPEPSSPEVRKTAPAKDGVRDSSNSSPEQKHKQRVERTHAPLNGVLEGEGIANATKGRRRFIGSTSSPRRLPDDKFNSIVKQLNGYQGSDGANGISNGTNGTSDHDMPTADGEMESNQRAIRKPPRKLSVAQSASALSSVHEAG